MSLSEIIIQLAITSVGVVIALWQNRFGAPEAKSTVGGQRGIPRWLVFAVDVFGTNPSDCFPLLRSGHALADGSPEGGWVRE